MKKKTSYTLVSALETSKALVTVVSVLLCAVASVSVHAQDDSQPKAKVKIYGNVYGGGELAQVTTPNDAALTAQLVSDDMLHAEEGGLFNKDTEHTYTTYVHLGTGAEVFGKVFGGGQGTDGGDEVVYGMVKGQTDVALDGATTWERIFGGGEMADVQGNTLVHFKKGKMAHDAYGGGLGKLGKKNNLGVLVEIDPETDNLPDNNYQPLASADIKAVPGFAGKATGNTFVVFDGHETTSSAEYAKYEYNILKSYEEIDGTITEHEQNQFDASRHNRLFLTDHNIYGGGMTAANVNGNTYTHINYGMIGRELLNEKHLGDKKIWDILYDNISNAQFCVFGGGYGYHAEVKGNTNVTMDIEGSHQHKYLKEFMSSFQTLWDGSHDDPTMIGESAEAAKWSHGAPGRSCMDVIGGGYNGRVIGSTNVRINGDVVVRKVYGGGYYASVGETNVDIRSGLFNRIYGGGLIGNVHGKANTTLGQHGSSQDIRDANQNLLVKDAVYGGNDISGTVGTSAPISHTITTQHNGEEYEYTFNVYNAEDDDSHGVRMNINGGLVLGDVYGAGNGNHTGYGNPDYLEFNLSQHPSENYKQLPHPGEKNTSLVYKYRPRTARVVMNLQGNEGQDYDDALTVDKVRIWGRTFGGGNSCNVGVWNGEQDDKNEVYADDATSWHPGDNFIGGGTIRINIGSNVQLGNRNDSHTNPNGLFMGSNGEHMITQHTDYELSKYYHQYYDAKTGKYWPGFLVYEDDAVTPIKRSVGLQAFKAFINTITTKSDNVILNIDEDATNVWMSNFVGGGYRGSMQAATENGRFHYVLPEGVTVGHSVVGGAFNAHVIYRVYATEYGSGEYSTDADGNFIYQTQEPEQGVISKAEAEEQGLAEYDYIRKLYAEGHEGEEEYKTGYLRYNFDGGMLAHDSEMNAGNTGSRIHQIHNPASLTTADFTCDGGYIANKEKALVHLELKNRLQPAVHEADQEAGTALNVHGGIVYGGCYQTGYVEGDSWVDYDCSLSPLCTDKRFFDKKNTDIYDEVADLQRNNALNVFGAGYGEDTHSMGDVYLCINSIGKDTGDENSDYPFIYNVFGGSNMGTVAGSTNVYYNGGKQGTMLGSLYGGSFKGDIDGNTYVELVQGFLVNVYAGSRQANIKGAAHLWAYDGSTRASNNIADDEYNHLIICNMYGGNDISGTIEGTMPATWTQNTWTDLQGKEFNTYIQVSGTNPGTKGFPLVGNVYGGGNGEQWSAELGTAPNVGTSLLEIDGGTTLRAFGGGNKATVTGEASIFVNAVGDEFADVSFTDYQKQILKDKFFHDMHTGYSWNGDELVMSNHHIYNLFGGNNVAAMDIQPLWNLKSGYVGNVYSGGNMGDMTYYNALAGTAGHEDETKGLCITVNSDDIHIESLYGGCRMSDVKAMDGENIVDFDEDEYGATVNVLKGNINNVYGGNDISGYIYNGTNVNLHGSITGNVYGAGNGDYIYAYNRKGSRAEDKMIEEEWNAEISKDVYWVKGHEDATPLQQLLELNNVRPHVAKAYLNIEGNSDEEKVYITGSVYCGGNASTIRPATDKDEDAHVKFNIGDNVICNEIFMGSNGASMKYDANNSESTYLVDFEKVNGLNLATDLTDADWAVLTDENTSDADHELITMDGNLRSSIYPNLLSVYMRAVDMNAMPLGFTDDFSNKTFHNTWIGTFCMGGNAGSMMIDQPIDIVFPQTLNFFGRIIGGSKDASFQYKDKWHRGGFRMPLAEDATLVDDHGDPQSTKAKLRMKIRSDWYSRRIVIDEAYKTPCAEAPEGNYLALDRTNDGENWVPDGKAWSDGCNVYGGCYKSGDMVGDVLIYIESDMLAYSRYVHEGGTIDDYHETALEESNRLNLPVANVYGAGYGPESRSYGDAYIFMKDIPGNVGYTHPSVNNIYGGGRNGMLVGNSVIHVHDGLVYKDVVGGCFAANLYGSSQVTVGYPKFYICRKTGEYTLDRADKWNVDYETKGKDGNEPLIKKTIKYFEGTYVPCNIYEQITGVKVYENNIPGDEIAIRDYLQNNKETDNDYFTFHNEYDDSPGNPENFFPENGWSDVEIRVRGGVYGGGFLLSNSTSTVAGTYTTLASTEQFNHGTDSQGNSSVGFGGNSSIIITDKGDTKDHIKISTDTTEGDGDDVENTGNGGIYGDGRLVFCEGFRTAELNGYGYAEGSPTEPLMLNTLQRLDLLTINDCCFKLYGDIDFATDQLDARRYSLARIGELRMNSSINADGNLAADKRNYIGFFNNIHYLGAIVTNDDFHNGKFHDASGNVDGSKTYRAKKQEYIDAFDASDKEAAAIDAFKQRNYATARNMVGIKSGYCLRVENQYYDGEEKQFYYGPIVGVAEVQLLKVQPGEGGGYVYADNIHADTYDSQNPSAASFMNESGNFVFEGVYRPGEDMKQYIVDDCLPKGFDETAEAGEPLSDQHYWYVIGDTYFYNTTLTAYTYNGKNEFNLVNADPNVIFAGIEQGSELQLSSVQWVSEGNAADDLRGGRDAALTVVDGSLVDALTDSPLTYQFNLQVADDAWSQIMPRSMTTDELITPGAWTTYASSASPQFNVRLIDNVNNCPKGEEEQYYTDHLGKTERVKMTIKARRQDGEVDGIPTYETKTYNVTLEIIYLQGPSFEGNVRLMNCALPGERIGFSSEGIRIKTTEQLPVTGYGWKLVPLDTESHTWDVSHAIDIPASDYSTTPSGHIEGSVPALYAQNNWKVYYTFHAGQVAFDVEPTDDEHADEHERMMVVHNYHRMNKADELRVQDARDARIYIEDDSDAEAFTDMLATYNFDGQRVMLTTDLDGISADAFSGFHGTFDGMGHTISLAAKGTNSNEQSIAQLFGNDARVCNLLVLDGSADETSSDYLYGRKAYQLNNFYTAKREAMLTGVDNRTDDEKYVEDYYANGDYQYAGIQSEGNAYLRYGAPFYNEPKTNHDTSHKHDVRRWNETLQCNEPLYEVAYATTSTFDAEAAGDYNDYIYFGQNIAMTKAPGYATADARPRAITHNGDGLNEGDMSNRVFRAEGYYRSTDEEGFFHNAAAVVLDPATTAVRFGQPESMTTDQPEAGTSSFNVDSNRLYGSEYSNATSGHVSQNLLVYNSGESIFNRKDADGISERNVYYHNIANGTTDYLHLVDKQDFCAPIAFTVTDKAWYERRPAHYAEGSNDAWEGICLPFTATRVEASLNGEITHFYGTPTQDQLDMPALNDKTLHHEYWLRGLVSVNSADETTTATFQRPGSNAGGLFAQGDATTDYVFDNPWFKATYGDLNYNWSDEQNDWYTREHTYEGYRLLTAGVPYIVSFPGERFYEFDLSSAFYNDRMNEDEQPQTITFSNSTSTVIPVTGTDMQTADATGRMLHKGVFVSTPADGVYTMSDDGTRFEANGSSALPFRTCMAMADAQSYVKSGSIIIGGIAQNVGTADNHNYGDPDDEDALASQMTAYGRTGSIVIDSNHEAAIVIYNVAGQTMRAVRVHEGTNTYHGFAPGVYIVNGQKLTVK